VCELEIEIIYLHGETTGWEEPTAKSIEVDDGPDWRKVVDISSKVIMW
jgi:hypothetical protein